MSESLGPRSFHQCQLHISAVIPNYCICISIISAPQVLLFSVNNILFVYCPLVDPVSRYIFVLSWLNHLNFVHLSFSVSTFLSIYLSQMQTKMFTILVHKITLSHPSTTKTHSSPMTVSVPVWSEVHVAGIRLIDLNPAIGTDSDTENWAQAHKDVVER